MQFMHWHFRHSLIEAYFLQYYIDPVSGYVFRSMKDALRYLESGDLGRLAFKPKDKSYNDVELEDDKTCVGASIMGFCKFISLFINYQIFADDCVVLASF